MASQQSVVSSTFFGTYKRLAPLSGRMLDLRDSEGRTEKHMTYKGTIRNGAVVLEPAVDLPEGAEIRVSLESPGDPPPEGASADKLGIWQALQSLPENAHLEDFVERVYLFYKIERGLQQLDSGLGIPHEEARKRFGEWLE